MHLPIFNQVWIYSRCKIQALPTLIVNCTLPLSNWWNMGKLTELPYLSIVPKTHFRVPKLIYSNLSLLNHNMQVIWSVLRISASGCWLNIVSSCVGILNKILERNNNMAETASFKTYGSNSYLSKTVHWFTQLVKNAKLV